MSILDEIKAARGGKPEDEVEQAPRFSPPGSGILGEIKRARQVQSDMLNDVKRGASNQDKDDAANEVARQMSGDENASFDREVDQDLSDSLMDAALTTGNYIIDGLDYLGNISRSTLKAGIDPNDSAATAAWEAALYKRRTSAEDMRDTLAKRMGMEKGELGFRQTTGEIELADFGNFAIDLGIDVVTDPLNWISLGTKSLITSAGKKAMSAASKEAGEKLGKEAGERIIKHKATLKEKAEKAKQIDAKDEITLAQKEKDIREFEEFGDYLPGENTARSNMDAAKQLGIMDQVEIDRALKSEMDSANLAATLGKQEGFATFAGALYGGAGAIGYAEDPEFTDVLMGAAAGAGGTATARAFMRSKAGRKLATNAGKILNKAVGPTKEVMMKVRQRGRDTLDAIETNIPGWRAAELGGLANEKAARAVLGIRNPIVKALREMRNDDAIAAGETLEAARYFRDMEVKFREDNWKRALDNMTPQQKKRAGLTKIVTVTNPKTKKKMKKRVNKSFAEAKGENVQALKEKISDAVRKGIYKPDGTIRADRFQEFADGYQLTKGMKVLNNFNSWNKAVKESFQAERDATMRNAREFLDEDGLMSPEEIFAARREAARKHKNIKPEDFNKMTVAEQKNAVKDLNIEILDEEGLRHSMQMKLRNEGLGTWVPTIGDKSMAITARQAKKPRSFGIRHKNTAAQTISKDMKRDFLSGTETRSFREAATEADKLKAADEFITAAEDAIDISARSKAANTLNTIEREYAQYLGGMMTDRTLKQQFVSRANSLVKRGLLLGSYTWIKNNLWSNARQAFVKHGLFGALDATGITKLASDLRKDMWDIFMTAQKDEVPFFGKRGKKQGVAAFDFKDPEVQDMINRGIIEPTHLKSVSERVGQETELERFLYTPEQREKLAKIRSNKLNKVFDWVEDKGDAMSMLLHTKQWGGLVEATARATTYQRTLKTLQGTDHYNDLVKQFGKQSADEAVKRQATEVTNDVFYDYGKLNYFERSFMREYIPFYSFYKQNLGYQTRALFGPDTVSRQATLARIGDGRYFGGEPLSQDQKDGMPDYVRHNNGFVWTDKDGKKHYIYSTSDPAQQAFNMLNKEYWFKGDFLQQLNPILKSLVEQASNQDFFRGEELSPVKVSEDPTRNIKYLFSRGYGLKPVYNAVSQLLGDTESAVWLDLNGNPVTDREWVARVDNVMSWLGAQWTNQALQFAGEGGKLATGKTTVPQIINKFIGPTQMTRAIPASEERRREEKELKRRLEENADIWDKERRALRYRNKID